MRHNYRNNQCEEGVTAPGGGQDPRPFLASVILTKGQHGQDKHAASGVTSVGVGESN